MHKMALPERVHKAPPNLCAKLLPNMTSDLLVALIWRKKICTTLWASPRPGVRKAGAAITKWPALDQTARLGKFVQVFLSERCVWRNVAFLG
jgi:hypothetical protein